MRLAAAGTPAPLGAARPQPPHAGGGHRRRARVGDLGAGGRGPPPFRRQDAIFIIDNMFSGSVIKVITLSGIVVKKIDLPYNENKIAWDGRSNKGDFLDSGIYLVVVENKEYGNGVAKLAIIR